MPYLLDTNHCSYLMNGFYKQPDRRKSQETNSIRKFQSITQDRVYMSEASLGELYYGAAISPHTDNIRLRIDKLKNMIVAVAADSQCWELFGGVKGELRKNGKKIEDLDLLIACIAQRYGCILVSNDEAFKNLPASFQVENWAE